MFGSLQHSSKVAFARLDISQGRQRGPKIRAGISEISRRTDAGHRQACLPPALAQTRIQHCRFLARIGTDDQNRIGLINACNACIEEIRGATPSRINHAAVLTAIKIMGTEGLEQRFERIGLFNGSQITDDATDLRTLFAFNMGCHGHKGFGP